MPLLGEVVRVGVRAGHGLLRVRAVGPARPHAARRARAPRAPAQGPRRREYTEIYQFYL